MNKQDYFKAICKYLPYGIKCKILNYKCDYVGEEFLTLKGYYMLGKEYYFNFHNGKSYAGKTTEDFKLLLTPLSEITKEELWEQGFSSHIDYLTHENKGTEWTLKSPWVMIEYLISKGYDVFGLIEKGYAFENRI